MADWPPPPIPGETPVDDVSGLIPKGVDSRTKLNALEAENIRVAVIRYLAAKPSSRQAPFTLAWSLKLHAQMFGKVWRWAGTIRTTNLNLGVAAFRVATDLHALLDDARYWRAHAVYDPVEQAARLHHRAVFIHPFPNGNGRWARMLANIWLKQADGRVIRWPDATIGDESVIRTQYITALRRADAGDYDAFVELHRRYVG